MAENREYKSDVFAMLMENKSYALQVYNALNGSSYDDPEMVETSNLQKIIALSIRNDAAFIVETDINIYEHQSSYNPNMPLRSIMYYSSIIKERVNNKDLHGSELVKIQTPHFIVFYNGKTTRPEKEVMHLSAAFEKPTDEPELELTCTVYNINPGMAILGKCAILREYTQFVEKVKENEREQVEEPIRKAIEYCIENHILGDFLRERGSEVINVMTIDMTFERRIEIMNERILEAEKRAEDAEKRVENAEKRAEDAEKRADTEKKRADTEKERADKLQLQADVAKQQNGTNQ